MTKEKHKTGKNTIEDRQVSKKVITHTFPHLSNINVGEQLPHLLGKQSPQLGIGRTGYNSDQDLLRNYPQIQKQLEEYKKSDSKKTLYVSTSNSSVELTGSSNDDMDGSML